jgi:hypothetical protein
MAQHKYSAGQSVQFSPDRNTDASARGEYTIIKTLPEAGGVLQYRVKAKTNGQERVVREDQLDRLACIRTPRRSTKSSHSPPAALG